MGGEGGGCAGQEAQEEEGCHGGPGEGAEQPWAAQQVCHHPALAGRPAAGVPQERASSRHLLPRVALARPAIPPRAQAAGGVRVSVWLQAEGGLHQPLPLQAGGESR